MLIAHAIGILPGAVGWHFGAYFVWPLLGGIAVIVVSAVSIAKAVRPVPAAGIARLLVAGAVLWVSGMAVGMFVVASAVTTAGRSIDSWWPGVVIFSAFVALEVAALYEGRKIVLLTRAPRE